MRRRDRVSANGLLPLMEVRKYKYTTSYRYHPIGGKPINLGTDKNAAIQKVLDMNHDNGDKGTIAELWRLYQSSPGWSDLATDTRTDYTQCSGPLLKTFGQMSAAQIKPKHIARYLRVERADASVRANREKALLNNLFILGIERGDLDVNPCPQVKANKERPRKQPPTAENLKKFLDWAWSQKGQGLVLAGMAEFAAVAGNRGVEFRELTWTQVHETEIRIIRAKQHGSEVVEVIEIDGMVADLIGRLRKLAKDDRHGWLFPNAKGNAYTAQAFKLGFNRLKKAATKAGMLPVNFTMHDLRSYFVTQYKLKNKALPDLHADSATTARIYDSGKEVARKGL